MDSVKALGGSKLQGQMTSASSIKTQDIKAPATLFNYEVVSKIGEGTYGVVYLSRSKVEPKKVLAIKSFKSSPREGEGVSPTAIREIMLLRELKHVNIVRLDSVHINRCSHRSHRSYNLPSIMF